MPTTGELTASAKIIMLDELRTIYDYSVLAKNAGGTLVSDVQDIEFNPAISPGGSNNASLSLSSAVTLTIDVGSDGADAVKLIQVVRRDANNQIKVEFELDTAIDFENGGSLVVTQLDVELNDPAWQKVLKLKQL